MCRCCRSRTATTSSRGTAGPSLTLDAAIDLVKREVWHSALDPLETMDITVSKPPRELKNIYVNVGAQQSPLQSEYGTR